MNNTLAKHTTNEDDQRNNLQQLFKGLKLYFLFVGVITVIHAVRPPLTTMNSFTTQLFLLVTNDGLQPGIVGSMFLHASTSHLLSNAILLSAPTIALGSVYSHRNITLAAIYIGIFASIAMVGFTHVTGIPGQVGGASTVGYGLCAAAGWKSPDMFSFINTRFKYLLPLSLIGYELLRMISGSVGFTLVNSANISLFSHLGHIFGVIGGIIIIETMIKHKEE